VLRRWPDEVFHLWPGRYRAGHRKFRHGSEKVRPSVIEFCFKHSLAGKKLPYNAQKAGWEDLEKKKIYKNLDMIK